ncbi:hypothetical protein SA2016_2868 [Sinomonas atrocyanea]|uniref:Uncharacterized protein n=1 Tax=Sinomonas atrocyanea TaxID=37927 RepID=A0A127A2J8_9MICC|nr:hypothetical protein [Sinomonas atrocyanea]AMM33533.1 hypothetical protein SA2016_2868 [Sinomonas atrocyanea]GEB62973.1 hypothetical protein SAT01_04210 [Sinomonas atrocyanea]GGG61827.1 hypothetical protein GCM10007172_11160 [Sinomonas atrocyanea]
MSATTLVDDRTAPEGHASTLAADGTAPRTGAVPRAEEPAPAVARVRFAALTGRLLMVLGALAVVTAYVLLPLAAALRAGAVLGGMALVLAAVIVVEAALAVALIVLKTQARH